MSVRFKFRSSVNFDSVDINGLPSISVRDLKSKIVERMNLKICQDFDLVISDADTGEEYGDENALVPRGSSVIIKRVPAGSTPSILPQVDFIENLRVKNTSSVNVDVDNFDDFGIDLCPVAEMLDSDPDSHKINYIVSEKSDKTVIRCSETSILRRQKLEPNDLSEATPRVSEAINHCVKTKDTSQTKLVSKMEEQRKLDDAVYAFPPAVQNADLPSELRCSLCNAIFKEAVMIPCCQHSFCDKCISLVLVEKAKCPKCSSTKCKVEDLLPNLSLRQAIERFLESQILISGSDNIVPKYAPDGESGIQANDVCQAMTITQRQPEMPSSPSATGRGSNQVMSESAYDSLIREISSTDGAGFRANRLGAGNSVKPSSFSQKIKQINGGRDTSTCFPNFKRGQEGPRPDADFSRESRPLELLQNFVQNEEANYTSKKKGWVNNAGGNGNFMANSRQRRGDRTCYMCGSPDHFIRDCPAASSPRPMFQREDNMFQGGMPACGPPYWQAFSHLRPYTNVYGAPGMMHFDPTMFRVAPFALPSYIPSMYAGYQVPCGLPRMGSLAPQIVTGADHPLSRSDYREPQDSEQKSKVSNKHQKSEQSLDGDATDEHFQYNAPEKSNVRKPHFGRGDHVSYSEDSSTQKSERKHPQVGIHTLDRRHGKCCPSAVAGRDQITYHSERSSSEVEDMSGSSNRHSNGRHKHQERISKNQRDRREHYGSDSSQILHQIQKDEDSKRKRAESDVKIHYRKHHSHSSGLEPSTSGDRKRHRKEKESCQDSRNSRDKLKSTDDQLGYDRWEMVNGFDEECREDHHNHRHHHHHHKRKRIP